ncbi:MAG TPA: M28 family peptidase [Candidatus Hydrogenedentes bacterium]|nr:M28 family peptidase [Candidatus Hydrogenedentota bacterium]
MLEFVVVSLIATWWPLVGAAYGAVVALLLVADLMGFPMLEGLVPTFTSRNIMGIQRAPAPRRMLVFTAHYDSGMLTPIQRLAETVGTRRLYLLTVGLAVQVVGACLVEGIFQYRGGTVSALAAYRWAMTWGLAAVGILHFMSGRGEPSRGANFNASGVAAVLALAARLREHPLRHCDALFLFPGAHREGMAGLRAFLARYKAWKPVIQLVHVEGVGMGVPAYVTAEGELSRRADPDLVSAAERAACSRQAVAVELHRPAGAWSARARGYAAITITSADSMNRTDLPSSGEDSLGAVSEQRILDAACFIETMARLLDDAAGASAGETFSGIGQTDENNP